MRAQGVVAAFERVGSRAVLDRLRARGWVEAPVGYRGYAGASRARVLGRVLLARPGSGDVQHAREKGVRGWRHFLTPEVPGVEVVVRVAVDGDAPAEVRTTTDAGGYVDVEVPVALPPGWHDAVLEVPATGRRASAPVMAVGSGSPLGLVSDIDDTVLHSAVTQPLRALWNAAVLHEDARLAVPGIAEVYGRLQRSHPNLPVVYLSTGAWSTEGSLRRFLASNGFPPGPLLLTDWGPSADRWFRDGRAHKRASLARLLEELPGVRWLLVGDSGQADRDVYTELARSCPDRVAAVLIREVTPEGQRVRADVAGVPVASVHDAAEAAAFLDEVGLLPAP